MQATPLPAHLAAAPRRQLACSALVVVAACVLPVDDDNESCLVMQDIEGNEFCLD